MGSISWVVLKYNQKVADYSHNVGANIRSKILLRNHLVYDILLKQLKLMCIVNAVWSCRIRSTIDKVFPSEQQFFNTKNNSLKCTELSFWMLGCAAGMKGLFSQLLGVAESGELPVFPWSP